MPSGFFIDKLELGLNTAARAPNDVLPCQLEHSNGSFVVTMQRLLLVDNVLHCVITQSTRKLKRLWWFLFWFIVHKQRFELVLLPQREVGVWANFVSGVAGLLTRDTFLVIKPYFSLQGCWRVAWLELQTSSWGATWMDLFILCLRLKIIFLHPQGTN